MDQRCLSLQERCRRGSLPLKKRRLSLPLEFDGTKTASLLLTPTVPLRHHSRFDFDTTLPSHLGKRVPMSCSRGDEHMKALASAALARSSVDFQYSHEMPLLPQIEHSKGTASLGVSLKARLLKAGAALQQQSNRVDLGPSSDLDSTTSSSEGLGSGDVTCTTTGKNLSSSSSDGLAATGPLPGGCHGTTTRTNAYCRRNGGFKGSNYCKLHYHLYVGRGHKRQRRHQNETESSSPSSAEHTASTSNSSNTEAVRYRQTLADNNNKGKAITVVSSSQQDKRFTGASGETCCQATTTRGRPCAYVAVDGAQFCNLHCTSSYSSSSSGKSSVIATPHHLPRRGKAGKGGRNSGDVSAADSLLLLGADSGDTNATLSIRPSLRSPCAASPQMVHGSGLHSLTSTLPVNTSVVLQSPGVSAPESSSRPASMLRTSSKRVAKYADSPHPLLSKIPVNQWFGKTVKIACGPMANEVGTVEKWGNGWITVRIPEVGTHNRRSFELYMVSEDYHEDEQATSSSSSQVKSPSMLRSTVSPSPSTDTEFGSIGKPCRNIVNNVSYSYDYEESPRLFETSMPAVVMETPRPKRELVGASHGGETETPVLKTPSGTRLCLKKNGGGGSGHRDQEHKVVTPMSPKKARTEIPLADSLLLAQEGGAKKYRIDMLFGTAALERSRRSIHRPSRYEDSPKK